MPIDERSKAMYQPWNEEGFNADIRVRKMSQMQRWIYRVLLQQAFVCSTRPRLPNDDEELWMLADCKDIKQWVANKKPILKMFEPTTINNQEVLLHRRLEEDWARILEIRETRSEAGKKSGESRRTKPNISSTDVQQKQANLNTCEQVSNEGNESNKMNVSNKNEEEIPENGQEITLKAKKEIPFLSRKILGVRAEIWESTWGEVKELERIYGSSEVCTAFEDWAKTKVGEIKDKPVTEFLKIADGLLMGTFTLSVDPTLTNLIDDVVYATQGEITFNDGQKFAIGKLLEVYLPAEILSAAKEFYSTVEGDAFKMKNASGSFIQQAEQLIKFARRKKAEKAQEAAAVERTAQHLQETAEAERRAREVARIKEQELVEEELPD